MTNEICRYIKCIYAGKFCGKAVCRQQHPKKYVKHMEHCPLVLAKMKEKEENNGSKRL